MRGGTGNFGFLEDFVSPVSIVFSSMTLPSIFVSSFHTLCGILGLGWQLFLVWQFFLLWGSTFWFIFGVLGLFWVKSSSECSGFLFFWGVRGGKFLLRCVCFCWLYLVTTWERGRAIFELMSWAHSTCSGPTVWAADSASPFCSWRSGAGLHAGI